MAIWRVFFEKDGDPFCIKAPSCDIEGGALVFRGIDGALREAHQTWFEVSRTQDNASYEYDVDEIEAAQ